MLDPRALLLAFAAAATPVQGMNEAASSSPTEADAIEIPADVGIALQSIVTQNNEYALRLVDIDGNVVENLPLSDRGSARVCVPAQTKPRKLKVVGVSRRDGQVLAAIVKRELDTQVYDVALWDRSTPHTVRVVATAKFDLSGAATANCGKP